MINALELARKALANVGHELDGIVARNQVRLAEQRDCRNQEPVCPDILMRLGFRLDDGLGSLLEASASNLGPFRLHRLRVFSRGVQPTGEEL